MKSECPSPVRMKGAMAAVTLTRTERPSRTRRVTEKEDQVTPPPNDSDNAAMLTSPVFLFIAIRRAWLYLTMFTCFKAIVSEHVDNEGWGNVEVDVLKSNIDIVF